MPWIVILLVLFWNGNDDSFSVASRFIVIAICFVAIAIDELGDKIIKALQSRDKP